MKKRIVEMEANLQVIQGIKQPERVKPWTVSRPANEAFILIFLFTKHEI